jgi:hypothetical protein
LQAIDHAFKWIRLVTNDTVLVLNRGTHYQPDSTVVSHLARLFAALTSKLPGAKIIYRATSLPMPGDGTMESVRHANEPLAAPLPLQALDAAWAGFAP